MANRIYLCLAHMSDEGFEQNYIKEAFDTNWVVPLGPNVNGVEKDLEDFVNSRDYNIKRSLDVARDDKKKCQFTTVTIGCVRLRLTQRLR